MKTQSFGEGEERRTAVRTTQRSFQPSLLYADFLCTSNAKLPPPSSYYSAPSPSAALSSASSATAAQGAALGRSVSEQPLTAEQQAELQARAAARAAKL